MCDFIMCMKYLATKIKSLFCIIEDFFILHDMMIEQVEGYENISGRELGVGVRKFIGSTTKGVRMMASKEKKIAAVGRENLRFKG